MYFLSSFLSYPQSNPAYFVDSISVFVAPLYSQAEITSLTEKSFSLLLFTSMAPPTTPSSLPSPRPRPSSLPTSSPSSTGLRFINGLEDACGADAARFTVQSFRASTSLLQKVTGLLKAGSFLLPLTALRVRTLSSSSITTLFAFGGLQSVPTL